LSWRKVILFAQAIITLGVIGAVVWSVQRSTETSNDVSAALQQLLRTQEITSEVFTCPTTQPSVNAEKWDFGGGANTALNWSNWNGTTGVQRNLSYSFQNPYASTNAITSGFRWNVVIGSDFAIASDINPGSPGDGDDGGNNDNDKAV